jgi:hypothetical protein
MMAALEAGRRSRDDDEVMEITRMSGRSLRLRSLEKGYSFKSLLQSKWFRQSRWRLLKYEEGVRNAGHARNNVDVLIVYHTCDGRITLDMSAKNNHNYLTWGCFMFLRRNRKFYFNDHAFGYLVWGCPAI